jgi:hypothetical protein
MMTKNIMAKYVGLKIIEASAGSSYTKKSKQ